MYVHKPNRAGYSVTQTIIILPITCILQRDRFQKTKPRWPSIQITDAARETTEIIISTDVDHGSTLTEKKQKSCKQMTQDCFQKIAQ